MFKRVLLLTCALGVASFGSHQVPAVREATDQASKMVISSLKISDLVRQIDVYSESLCLPKVSPDQISQNRQKIEEQLRNFLFVYLDSELNSIQPLPAGSLSVPDEDYPLVERLIRDLAKASQSYFLKLLLQHGSVFEVSNVPGYQHGVLVFTQIRKLLLEDPSKCVAESEELTFYRSIIEKVMMERLKAVHDGYSGEKPGHNYGPFLVDLAGSMLSAGTLGAAFINPPYCNGSGEFGVRIPSSKAIGDMLPEDADLAGYVLYGLQNAILNDDLYQDINLASARPPFAQRFSVDELKARLREFVGRGGDAGEGRRVRLSEILECMKNDADAIGFMDADRPSPGLKLATLAKGIQTEVSDYKEGVERYEKAAREVLKEYQEEVEPIITKNREFVESVGHFFFNSKGEIEYHPFLMKPGYLHKGAEDFRKAETEGLEGVWKFVLRMHSVNRMINLLQLVAEKEPEGKIQKVRGLEGLTKLVEDERRLREKWTWESWKALGKEERTEFVSEYLMLFMNIAKLFSGRDGLSILQNFNELSPYIIQDFIRAGNREEAKEVVSKFLKPTLESEDSDLSDDSDSEETSSFSDSSDPETEQEDGVLEFDQLVVGLRKKDMENIKWQEYKSIREMRGTLRNFGKDDFKFLGKSHRFLLPTFKDEKLARSKSGPEGKGRDWNADDISAIKKYIESHKGEYNNDSKKLEKAFKRAGVEVNGKSVFASSVTEHLFSLASGVVSLLRDLEYVDQLENENKREDARKKLKEAANDDGRRDRSIEEDGSETVIVV